MGDQEIRNEVVETMLRKDITGGHKKQVETVVGWAVASHDEGRAKQLIDEMLADPSSPIQGYGGHRSNIQLTSEQDAKEYLKANGRDVPDWL